MRKFLPFLICACFFCCQLVAQTDEVVRIRAGQDPATTSPLKVFISFLLSMKEQLF